MRFALRFHLLLICAALFAAAAAFPDASAQPNPPRPSYEIWITNQSRDSVMVFDSRNLRLIREIPVDDDGLPATSKPHTISFSPDGLYAYVANVGAKAGTRNLSVIRTVDRKLVASIPAGPGTHMVIPSADGTAAYAANAGGDSVLEILTDTREGRFTPGRRFSIQGTGDAKAHPICIGLSTDGAKLFVTNAGDPKGNPETAGFLAVLSTATGKEIARIPGLGNEACGFAQARDGSRLFFTIGGTVGRFAILDAKTHRIITQQGSGGKEPHGIALNRGGHQVWMTNRQSNNVTVVSTTTGAHYRTFFNIGDKPDLLDFSPDGDKVIITLRGEPATPMAGGSGKESGFVILNTETGKILSKVSIEGDPHGIAVRTRNR